ncbi:hypothetical protein TcasGA2_TC005693 [Tribolium castaneum]|uniref:Uncharacterized protein n=1 Tax=Tribolium castaneum TaxID=7070 RepID=D6WWS0_TRICA|nr:hypothetical protein TcasGA2_TC005693 [Tribolium castaneum]
MEAMECYNCTGTEDCNKDSVFDDTVTCEGICMWGTMYTPNQPPLLGERFMACYEGTEDEAYKYCYNLQQFRQGFCNTCDDEDLCNYH